MIQMQRIGSAIVVLGCLLLTEAAGRNASLPVVLWHGMGASSGAVGGTSVIKKVLEDHLGSYVLSISTGKDAEETYSGFFGNITAQVDSACAIIASKAELQNGYNGLGLSQGGLFLRALAERCDAGPRMHTLVTLGSPHQGVVNIPACTSLPDRSSWSPVYWVCRSMQKALEVGAYLPWVRDHVIQAQYYRDPDNESKYLRDNVFLPEINNEKAEKSEVYKKNLAALDQLVLFRFSDDFTVVPRDSAWFTKAIGDQELELRDTDLWKEDFIGLQTIAAKGGLIFAELPGYHMHFTEQELIERIIKPYLRASHQEQMEIISEQ